jgi:hypothetical protein
LRYGSRGFDVLSKHLVHAQEEALQLCAEFFRKEHGIFQDALLVEKVLRKDE